MLESFRIGVDGKVVKAMGLVFEYSGKFHWGNGIFQGKRLDRHMMRKCRNKATKPAGVEGLGYRDPRHTWKTNAQRTCMDETIPKGIVGYSNHR